MTHHLRGLAREIGGPAVTAQASGTNLTPAGEILLPHARAIVDRAQRARAEVRGYVAVKRTRVKIAMFPTLAARALPTVKRRLEREGMNVSVVEAEKNIVMDQMERLRLDAAFVYSTSARVARCPEGFWRIQLFEEGLMVFVASNHRLATSRSTSIADLARERWVLGAQVDEPLESLVLAVAQRSGFAPRAVARSDDYRVVAAYVAAGFGVAVMPAGEARLQPPGVTVLLLEDLDMVRSIELLVPETLPTEVVTHLVDAMSGVAQTLRLPQEAQG